MPQDNAHPFAQLDFGPLRKRPATDARRSLTEMLPLSVNRRGAQCGCGRVLLISKIQGFMDVHKSQIWWVTGFDTSAICTWDHFDVIISSVFVSPWKDLPVSHIAIHNQYKQWYSHRATMLSVFWLYPISSHIFLGNVNIYGLLKVPYVSIISSVYFLGHITIYISHISARSHILIHHLLRLPATNCARHPLGEGATQCHQPEWSRWGAGLPFSFPSMIPVPSKWMMTGGSPMTLSGWWFGCHQFYFPIYWE